MAVSGTDRKWHLLSALHCRLCATELAYVYPTVGTISALIHALEIILVLHLRKGTQE